MATDKYSYYTDEGDCYSAMELTVPGSDITSDIIAVFFDKEDGELTMVDYIYGASMMSDEEIWNFLINSILKHRRES